MKTFRAYSVMLELIGTYCTLHFIKVSKSGAPL